MDVRAELEQLTLAAALLSRRARVAIVHQATGLARGRLRMLHRQIHGTRPACGQLPGYGGMRLQTRGEQIEAGFFAALYAHHAGTDSDEPPCPHTLIAVYDLYRELTRGEAPLDVNAAWVIAHDLALGTASLRPCPRCAVVYLAASASRLAPTCPFCALYERGGGQGRAARWAPPAWIERVRAIWRELATKEALP